MKTFLLLSIFLSLFSVFTFGQSKPDYSGKWILDKEKSNLERLTQIISMIMDVDQTENEITITTTAEFPPFPKPVQQNNQAVRGPSFGLYDIKRSYVGDGTYNYSLNGEERVIKSPNDSQQSSMKIKGFFENELLKLQSIRVFQGLDEEFVWKAVETWELTDNGKSLKIVREGEIRNSEIPKTELVFIRK